MTVPCALPCQTGDHFSSAAATLGVYREFGTLCGSRFFSAAECDREGGVAPQLDEPADEREL